MAPLKGKSLSLVIGLVGAVGFVLQGYDQAVANGLLTLGSFIAVFPQIDTVNTSGGEKAYNSKIQGTVVAIYEVGCALGAGSCAFLGDRLGRRKTIFLAGCTALVGIAIQASPFSLGQLIAGRVITGLGVGGFTATIPMYVSESSGAEARGRMVLLEGWFAIGGVALATWLEFGFYYVSDNSVSWRFPIAFQGLFGLVVVVCIMLLPESPRWLARVGRLEEAAEVLARMENVPIDSERVLQELEMIRQSLAIDENTESAGSSSPFALTKNRHLHRTVIAVAVNILAQMTGVNIITFYSDTIFQSDLGYSGTLSRIITGCLQIWQCVAAGLAVLLIDRLGRRPLLIAAAAGMTVAQACLAGLSSDLQNRSAAGASLLFYFVALFCFPIGLFIVPFMYAAEIAPLRTRAKVTAMSAAANWLFNFVLAEVSPVGFATIHWRYYIVYTCISAFACVCFYLFCPETKGRTLEEIDDIFVQSKSVFDTVRIAREMPYQAETFMHAKDTEKGGLEATQMENARK
ncbi:General substrate transporter [Penicillium cf. griseofulvum]|uniref:General substrate transporter n=1 Tax=Penicillium cf. griseofulvum TaxID=2972120 RepID=A0A9W9M256_9EURO|nr:General substrate transporter [Penicillium cf. griseofulvum]KAJ5430292.1 General substrate transporter [Penicillium cf. griseofulvum]